MDSKEIEFIAELKVKAAEINEIVEEYGFNNRVLTLFFMGLFDEDHDEESEVANVKAMLETNILTDVELAATVEMVGSLYDGLNADSDIGFDDYNISLN
jgi:hypothetical protein